LRIYISIVGGIEGNGGREILMFGLRIPPFRRQTHSFPQDQMHTTHHCYRPFGSILSHLHSLQSQISQSKSRPPRSPTPNPHDPATYSTKDPSYITTCHNLAFDPIFTASPRHATPSQPYPHRPPPRFRALTLPCFALLGLLACYTAYVCTPTHPKQPFASLHLTTASIPASPPN